MDLCGWRLICAHIVLSICLYEWFIDSISSQGNYSVWQQKFIRQCQWYILISTKWKTKEKAPKLVGIVGFLQNMHRIKYQLNGFFFFEGIKITEKMCVCVVTLFSHNEKSSFICLPPSRNGAKGK